MAYFDARYIRDFFTGRKALQLSIRAFRHAPDENEVKAIITKGRNLNDFDSDRIPVCYHFEDEQPEVRGNRRADPPIPPRPSVPAKLIIIAGPGVAIELRGLRDIRGPRPNLPLIDVYRVQDPHLVPTQGAPFSVSDLVSTYFLNTNPPRHIGATPVPTEEGERPYGFFDSRFSSEEALENYNGPLTMTSYWYHIIRFDPIEYLGQLWGGLFSGEIDLDQVLAGRSVDPEDLQQRTHVYLPPQSHIEIHRLHDGVRFFHPYSSQVLEIRVSRNHFMMTPRGERTDHLQRFAYSIDHDSSTGLPRVTVVKTANVRAHLTINFDTAFTNESREDFQRRIRSIFFTVKNTNFDNIPPQGQPLPTHRLSRAIVGYEPPPWVAYLQIVTDLTVSFIPGFGDAVDIAEFIYAMVNGTDRWGHRLEGWEKALMGAGAVLTLVGPSIAVLRRVPRLLSSNVRAVRRVHSAMEAARYTQEEKRFLAEMYEQLSQGRRLTAAQARRVQELLRRIPRCSA